MPISTLHVRRATAVVSALKVETVLLVLVVAVPLFVCASSTPRAAPDFLNFEGAC